MAAIETYAADEDGARQALAAELPDDHIVNTTLAMLDDGRFPPDPPQIIGPL